MVRGLLGVVLGFVLWSVLWLGSGVLVQTLFKKRFRSDGSTDSLGMLITFLVISVIASLGSGRLCARVSGRPGGGSALLLALLLLGTGIFVQMSYWDVMPKWYHLTFLLLLVPMTLIGSRYTPK